MVVKISFRPQVKCLGKFFAKLVKKLVKSFMILANEPSSLQENLLFTKSFRLAMEIWRVLQ